MEESKFKKGNHRGGRKSVPVKKQLRYKLQFHLDEVDYMQFKARFEASGFRSQSQYLRKMLFADRSEKMIVNPIEFLALLDQMGTELKRIGNNINQTAKYANQLQLAGIWHTEVINIFNQQMQEYLATRRELVKAYRAMVRALK